MDQIDKNIAYFEKMLEEWLKAGLEGKWVTIVNEELVGHFDTSNAAYEAGTQSTGTSQEFLIKQVVRGEEEPRSTPALLVGAIRVDR